MMGMNGINQEVQGAVVSLCEQLISKQTQNKPFHDAYSVKIDIIIPIENATGDKSHELSKKWLTMSKQVQLIKIDLNNLISFG